MIADHSPLTKELRWNSGDGKGAQIIITKTLPRQNIGE